MIPNGLERFRDHFRDFADSYALIGGTACAVQFADLGESFRATTDFDVLILAADPGSGILRAMSAFVAAGGYTRHIDAQGRHRCFRFLDPVDLSWPGKIELCASQNLTEADARAFFPLARPADGPDMASLSAIAFDAAYVDWIRGGIDQVQGVAVASLGYLLPLKALAWKNLTAARDSGEHVDSRAIRKHKLDCFRIISMLSPTDRIALPATIAADVAHFIAAMEREQPGLPPELDQPVALYLAAMRTVYGLT